MSLLLDIIYRAHARGTHHKLALDALEHLTNAEAGDWRRLFMKHVAAYVQGAKAPDDEFKDFENHVLHVRDGYWGGAPEKVENWYGHLVKALAGQRWSEAAWAAGVLSHYYTDVLQPFHTAHWEAENNIHRAAEWSISCAFDSLRAEAATQLPTLKVKPGEGPAWLRAFVAESAEAANQHYEKLIAHYDINRGVVDPPSGLDVVGRRIISELIARATTGFAAILDRAITEASVKPPQVALAGDVAASLLRLPLNAWRKRTENAAERRVVEAMYDELKATGRVEETLPEDERVLREAYARDVLARQLAEREKERGAMLAVPSRYARGYATTSDTPAAIPPAPAQEIGGTARSADAHATPAAPTGVAPPAAAQPTPTEVAAPVAPVAVPAQPAPPPQVVLADFTQRENAQRVWLAAADDVEKAPSIGPRMAERLYAVGVKTVGDLFAAKPEALAEKLDHRTVDDATIVDWQDQARLVCTIPGLRGTHAQLLVGSGFRTRDAVASAPEDKLCAAVLSFALSPEGQRILRDGNPPDLERIKSWLASAIAAKAA